MDADYNSQSNNPDASRDHTDIKNGLLRPVRKHVEENDANEC